MIYIIVQRGHEYTVRNFLDSWGRKLREQMTVWDYTELVHARRLPRGTYIFADHDRLSEPDLALAGAVADQLTKAGCRVLSNPNHAMRRVHFLDALREAGINDFRAINVHKGIPDDLRYPVFIRCADDHSGPKSALLNNRAELDAAIAASEHKNDPHLIVVEFIDTRDHGAGPYRKFAAMRIADRIVPRHAFASEGWMTKLSDTVDPDWIENEEAFFERFERAHAADVMKVFQLAGIEFGRLDFALTNGRMRAWEINSNPMIVSTPDVIDSRRLVLQAWTSTHIVDAIKAIDDPTPTEAQFIRIDVDDDLRRAAGMKGSDGFVRFIGKLAYRLGRLPCVPEFWAWIARAERIARL